MGRSTRNKVRFQIEKSADCMDRCLAHLKNATDLGDGNSTPINASMPNLVSLVLSVKDVLLKFRSEL
ncbi:hypothetical protein LCGC14_0888480 [marine sediment metagenome]|uniref:Uncharacterized protein n=1 Tax=marine sediment metagenome TaxID=412755 RepID=A0A0F9NZY0_9ZZZZ